MNRSIVVVALLAGACGKSKTEGDHGAATSAPTGEAAKMAEELAPWMPKGVREAWQGAWTSRMTLEMGGTHSMAGDPVAMEITGDNAKVFDGKQEAVLGMRIDSPCQVTFTQQITEGSMKGGQSFHAKQFVIVDGKLVAGEGDVGMRKGTSAIACVGGRDAGTYVLDEKGGCIVWEDHFGKPDRKIAAKCVWTKEDGKDVLKIGDGDWAAVLYVKGDVLMSNQFDESTKLQARAKDYASAKESVIAKNKADDPSEKAKAKGGKVGDLTSILGLRATWGTDKTLKGKPLELTALYLNSNDSSSGDKHFYSAELVDSKELNDFSLHCELAGPPPAFTQYDKVIAKGTVDESFGVPSLKDCSVVKAP